MKHLFHTEDCGVSLLCRCCRSKVCSQRLSKADRLRVQRDWEAYPAGQGGKAYRSSAGYFARFAVNLLERIAAWRPSDRGGRSKQPAAPARRRVS